NNPRNPVIGVRSFGEDHEAVAALGAASIRGYQEEGVSATAKHFPGHGDTSVDSHLGRASVPHDRERLNRVELYPFIQAIKH
ncbi:glycoside hydrolase family 3 N-terminal domain-containing protein, partial [Streptomyces sp. URMC 124]|uniref:glycoside hydrolase family 3 N-terminal domain-containing protein n=1 Tax=Streptomyces sp. URMC 124 TaxID=3423405 RepID=UPI003F5380D5